MITATYDAAVKDLNNTLALAGISTVTFTLQQGQTIDAIAYANVIHYSGYYSGSESLKMNQTILSVLGKYGVWVSLKSPAEVITPPTPPSNDHYNTVSGYYESQDDITEAVVAEQATQDAFTTATNVALNQFKNTSTSQGYELVTYSSACSLGALDGSNNRALAVTINITMHEPV